MTRSQKTMEEAEAALVCSQYPTNVQEVTAWVP